MQLSAGRQPRHHQCRFTIATNTLLIEPSQRLDRRAADQRRPIPSFSLFGPYLPQNYKFCTTTENLPPVDNKYYTTLLPHTSLLTSKAVQTNFSACQSSTNLVQVVSYGGEVLLDCWKLKDLLNDERPSQEDNQEDESDDDSDNMNESDSDLDGW
ncbi:hypothetical protein FXO37_19350 [Capsicum annuum]|nr:hypothetical protein FXO37_19350 [Capsicum annuum]